MAVHKIVLRHVVLVEADTAQEARSRIESESPTRLMERCDDGDAVGLTTILTVETVRSSDVTAELEALGSSAGFFGEPDLEDHLLEALIPLVMTVPVGGDPNMAAESALSSIVETDDVIGDGGIHSLNRVAGTRYRAVAAIRFRTMASDAGEALDIGRSMLAEILARHDVLENDGIILSARPGA